MKEVFIISTGQLVRSKTAGAQRVMNIAKALAAGGVNVFLCSFTQVNSDRIESCELSPGVFYLKSIHEKEDTFLHILIFLRSVGSFMKSRQSYKVIYLYPTVFVFKDFFYLIYFKFLKRYKFYCDINELRATNASSSTASDRIILKLFYSLKADWDYIIYKLSEFLVLFYDGIVVISSNLERYFSKFGVRILKIPVLCDITKISDRESAIFYDGTAFKICFAGSINCRKEGFHILFEALYRINKVANTGLYLYGIMNEKDKKELTRLGEKYNLQKTVFYMGNVEPDELLSIFPDYHLLIIPRPLTQQTKYGFSTKLSEYLISGVPVLVTNVSDNAVYIKDNFNGYIITPGSVSAMETKLLEIIKNYNNTRAEIVRNAYTTASKSFDYNLYTSSLINFLYQGKSLNSAQDGQNR